MARTISGRPTPPQHVIGPRTSIQRERSYVCSALPIGYQIPWYPSRGVAPRTATAPKGREECMLQAMRSRKMVFSVAAMLAMSVGITGVADAQSACPQEVIGTSNLGNQYEGELIGTRTETSTTTTTSGSTSGTGTVSGTTGTVTGTVSGTATSGTTSTTTSTSYNVGTYQFSNGQTYEVNCSNLKVMGPVASRPTVSND